MISNDPKPLKPTARMKMSPEGRARLRATEKAIYRYYNDMGKNKGHCTWGVGILAHKGVCTNEELGRKVSVKMVDQEFERKIAETEAIIHRNITVELNQDQFDALCSLAYNAGPKGSSDTFMFVNRGDFAGAANNMSLMIKVTVIEKGKKKLVIAPGLIKRRAEESAPFRIEKAATATSK
ncbi:lysozyme [Massilia sp. UBA6681]|uniref:lysozyme n=1 Tax=Massilia sp. UBA6681 TaxID=1946839 RepID=UPI0025C4777B|nr:lysozyme [Massilia sp. UBA6681]